VSLIRRFLCRFGRHVITDFSINAHWHEDGSMWMTLTCAACLRRLDHHQVPASAWLTSGKQP
jgi:hypothetical protein